jgi:hypothetical protein
VAEKNRISVSNGRIEDNGWIEFIFIISYLSFAAVYILHWFVCDCCVDGDRIDAQCGQYQPDRLRRLSDIWTWKGIFAIFVIAIAAEAAVGLALIISVYRNSKLSI